MKFTWDEDKCDDDLYNNGILLAWVYGRTQAIQNFVEALSYRTGSKADFSRFAGRAIIRVYKEAYKKSSEALTDEEFMSQFIVPYSKESYENGTYFTLAYRKEIL